MGIEAAVKAAGSMNKRFLGAAVFEEKGGAANGALAESKAVSSHRTPRNHRRLTRYSPPVTRHPLELWVQGERVHWDPRRCQATAPRNKNQA
jgi:hypothetical protein